MTASAIRAQLVAPFAAALSLSSAAGPVELRSEADPTRVSGTSTRHVPGVAAPTQVVAAATW